MHIHNRARHKFDRCDHKPADKALREERKREAEKQPVQQQKGQPAGAEHRNVAATAPKELQQNIERAAEKECKKENT